MKILERAAGALLALAMIFTLLISSVEIAAYGDWSYYEKEYERLHVLDTVPMTMDDLMEVTREMMSYLRGGRDDLVVVTTIDGVQQEFFNDREKSHMADVRTLFLGGLALRRAAVALIVLCLIFLAARKAPLARIIPRCYGFGCLAFLIVTGILGALFATDFTRYFTIFHEIFFDNDMWLLDPATSNLINIVPEPFWSAIALRVTLLFVLLMALVLAACLAPAFLSRKRRRTVPSGTTR